MNPNTEYERFTQEIYRQLSQATRVNAADVQHNVKMEGRSGQKHQIDVYWEYEKDGKTHRVAIECKNYNRRISLEKVCAFKGVLDDLDSVNGIMVSKEGFQRGAIKYAQKYQISLKELRAPRTNEETIIGKFVNCIQIESRHSLFRIDEKWAIQNNFDIQRYRDVHANLSPDKAEMWKTATHLPFQLNNRNLSNGKGIIVSSLDELEKRIPEYPSYISPYIFKLKDAYLNTYHFGLVKIKEVKYCYEIDDVTRIISLDAGIFVKAILKDAQSNETDLVALL